MTTEKEIFLIPYAHLDTQWRWEYPTTIKKYIKNTLEENIHLFEKYPEHRFNFTGALRYNMMKEYYPEQFEKIKTFIEEDRWALAGTCLDETDALVPSVESMIRNILYGDRWAKKEFGKSSRDYMIPDCFGFPANMPTVLTHCGIHGFSSQKLTWGSAVGIPFELGIWDGPDGGELVSALNPCSYASHLIPPIPKNAKRLERLNNLGMKNGIWKSFQYYGVGDIGGAPTEDSVKRAISSMKNASEEIEGLVVRQGSPDQFFREITPDERKRMDRYSGDFLLINHSAGTLTSAAVMKRWNRKNEQMAFAAEVAAVIASSFAGAPYPIDKIKSAWYRILGNQMHDILPGTSTPFAYNYSQNDEIVALTIWNTILLDSASIIAPFVKGDGSILLFNPLGETRKDIVDIELPEWNENRGNHAMIIDGDGKSFPVQLHKKEDGNFIATFIPELKPCSWTRFSITSNESQADPILSDAVSLVEDELCYVLENSMYRVKILKSGQIKSIFYKPLEKELLKKPMAYEFQKERPSKYPAWNMDWKDRKKPPFLRLEQGNTVSIIENGPLRCTIQITTEYHKSKFVKAISLSSESEIVEFSENINWRETGCSLKLALNANMEKPEVTYNWETSRMNRGVNKETIFEMPSRYWVDLCEQDWGISIIEDSKYGYDHPRDDTLRMTLLYTPALQFISGFCDQKSHDWGEHTIRYGICGHKGDFKGTDHLARRFNQGVRSFSVSKDLSSERKEDVSLLQVSDTQLGILAVKKPEESDGILIRVYERYGKNLDTEITFNSPLLEVKEVNGLEEPLGDIPFNGSKLPVHIDANGIRTYIIKLKNPPKSLNIIQESLKLDNNCFLIGDKENNLACYPAEITPSKISAGPISYQLANKDSLNALQCQSQKIDIPEGYNTISILASSEQEVNAIFKWLDKENNVIKDDKCHISSIIGYLGQWDTRIWKKEPKHHLKNKRDYLWRNKCTGVQPGFINRDRMEWYSTHTHKDGEDQPYQYGYMFTITRDIPSGATSLVLPAEKTIYILAITVSQQFVKVNPSQHLRDKFDF